MELGGWTDAKNKLFKNMVMPDIKLKGIKYTITCYQIFCPYTPWTPGVGSKGKSIFEGGYVAYQIKRNEVQNILQAKCLTLHVCTT